jgi:PKD repeat protein
MSLSKLFFSGTRKRPTKSESGRKRVRRRSVLGVEGLEKRELLSVFPNTLNPPGLPAPTGNVVNVSNVSQLQAAIANMQSGETVLIASGTYNLAGTLYVPQNLSNIAIRGATGKAGDVIIKGDAVIDATAPYSGSAIWGAGSGISGSMPFGIWLGNVSNVTIADLTLQNFVDDAIILNAGVQSPLIHDVTMLDTGEQLLKSNPNPSGGGVNNGIVEYCTIGYSVAAPNNYTNGIDVHTGQNWIIRDDLFKNIFTTNTATTLGPGALAGPAVLIWNGSKNATVAGNTFINCQREIALGLSDPTQITDDNYGGIIENNFIYRSGVQHGDVAIGVWNSPNTEVAYNTVILNGDYPNAIEYRFSTTTGVKILYNITDAAITQRDGASATVTGNVNNPKSSWFVNESIGDLHLTSAATAAIGHGVYLSEAATDYDGQTRPSTGPTDVGADQFTAATTTPLTANAGSNLTTNEGASVTFVGTASGGTGALTYKWTFGDGGSSSGSLTPSHTYTADGTYTATLTVTDASNTSVSSNVQVSVGNVAPTVSAGGPYSGTAGTAISFTSKATVPDTGDALTYSWSFGDSSVASTSQNPTHTYAAAGTYTATLTVTDSEGASTKATATVTVAAPAGPPIANAGPNQTVNEGSKVTFAGNASGGTGTLTYSWTFGDGGTSTGSLTPTHTYFADGNYTVTLTVTDSNNKSGSSTTTVTVNNVAPTVTIGGPYSGTAGTGVSFTGSGTVPDTGDALTYSWNFGDGSATSTTQNPTHSYAAAGTYTATLTVTDSEGLSSKANATVTITSATPPPSGLVAAYNFDQGSGTTLTDLSGNGNNGTITNATWSTAGKFGNALSFNGAANSYVTINSSTSLNLTNGMTLEAWVDPTTLNSLDGGWAAAVSKEHQNSSNDIAYALYAANGTGTGPAGHILVNGTDYGASGSSVLALNKWVFLTATYVGTTLQTYVNGKLVASQTIGGSITTTSNPLRIGGDWSGEMFTGLIDNVRIYNKALTQAQIKADMTTPVTVGTTSTPPTVTSVSPANGATLVSTTATAVVTFSEAMNATTINSSSIELLGPSNTVVAATVTYNTANFTATITPTSSLAANTVYTIQVLGGSNANAVKDANGNVLAATYTSTFTTDPPAGPLTANAGSAITTNEGSSVTFAGTASGGSGSLTYAWTFGDGGTASGTLTPTHTYASDGSYTAKLTVTDSTSSTTSSSVAVTVNNVAPTVKINGPYSGTTTAAVSFTGSGTVPDSGDALSYAWNFGDGSTSTVQNPSHTYAAAGTYTVTLTVTDSEGAATQASTTATIVAPLPLTASAGSAITTNEGSSVTFVGTASGGTGTLTYSWTFGDGGTASGSLTPTHTYASDGSYTAKLTVTDSTGATTGSTVAVTVNNVAPTVNPGGPYSGSPGTSISFTGTGSVPDTADTLTYSWNFGDGSTSTAQDPTHSYTTAGNYSVTLTVTDSEGASTKATTTANVSSIPIGSYNTNATITTSYLTIPNFGASPTNVSIKSGNWSDPTVWSAGRIPVAGDIVDIGTGTTITYDLNSTVALNTIAVQNGATLTFRTDINTQVIVGNFLVLDGGSLIVGTASNPIASNANVNIVIANQAINTAIDPKQFGTGLIVLGNVTMHGMVKTPYVTLAQEAHAGDTVLHLASPVTGWQPGDDPLLPDTRQLAQGTNSGSGYQPQWERAVIKSVSADGLTVYLTAPLKYDHLGARDAAGVLDFLPQIMNDNRNIMVDSQSFTGTRGYTLFTNRANVDIEYAGFCELGRTTNNPTSSSNVADRYAMTMLDLIGPTAKPANGYQFTLIGNEVDNDGDGKPNNNNIQWGLALNNSFYGLIQDNTVFAVAGAGMGVEDGASSYNTFDHNFVANVTGSSARLDDQFQGDGYWFHNPNNYVTNNIATDINPGGSDVYSYGFSVDATTSDSIAVGTVAVPLAQGDDPSVAGQSTSVDMNAIPLLQFSGNQVYGATSRGFATWWLGTLFETSHGSAGTMMNSIAWNTFNAAYFTYETTNLVINGFTVRGDASQLNNPYNYSTGLYFGDYMTRNALVENVDIQDEATGIVVPSNVGRGGASDVVKFTIQNSYLRNTTNIDVPLLMSSNGGGGLSSRQVIIQNDLFAQPLAAIPSGWQAINIAMDSTESGDPSFYNTTSSAVVDVYSYNKNSTDNFQVYYAYNKPSSATTRSLIDGYITAL